MIVFLWSCLAATLLLRHATALQRNEAPSLGSVKNLRAVVPGAPLLYRSATLDDITLADAERLLQEGLDGKPLVAVLDLRNRDEIKKGAQQRSDGAKFLYESLLPEDERTIKDLRYNNSNHRQPTLFHRPLLNDIDAFWEEAIDRMDPMERMKATLQTTFQAGALDRAAARHLERNGHAMLYQVMMATAPAMISSAIRVCQQYSNNDGGGAVLFHCQKGKDRTGVLAMLLQSVLDISDEEIIDAYAMSGPLLGELERDQSTITEQETNGGLVDWSHFRGSPALAMEQTLEWTRQQYGSVENYLVASSLDQNEQERFRRSILEQTR